jgi:hypothetical protein
MVKMFAMLLFMNFLFRNEQVLADVSLHITTQLANDIGASLIIVDNGENPSYIIIPSLKE